MDIVPQCKSSIQSRFSTLRFMKVVNRFNPIQIGFISKHHLDSLRFLPDHLMVPIHFQQWLADHMSSGDPKFFQHKEKRIDFTKDIVDKVFGFPFGTKPFSLESTDPDTIREVKELRDQYKQGKKKIPVSHVVSMMLASNSEIPFIRSFIMFFLTVVLCPATYDHVNAKYLYSLKDSDIPEVGNLDFGSLCLNHLWTEVKTWKERVFDGDKDFNRLLWIGGCLPLVAAVYLDFANFNGNIGPIDYRIPRMNYLRNEDFLHLVNLDRNYTSRKSYGMLQIKDISLTPYSEQLDVFPANPELDGPNAILENVGIVGGLIGDAIAGMGVPVAEDDVVLQDVIEISDSQGDSDSLGSYTIEPEDMFGSPQSVNSLQAIPSILVLNEEHADCTELSVDGMNSAHDGNNIVGDGLVNIATCYAELSDSYDSEEIAEDFVIRIEGAPVRDEMQVASTSQSRFELRMPEIEIDSFVEEFYYKYLRRKIFKTENPIVLKNAEIEVSYEKIFNSFKPRGDVDYGTMSVHSRMYSHNARIDPGSELFLKKFMFSSYMSEKLLASPSAFDKKSVVGMLNWILYTTDFDITKMDILHFPSIISSRWVLMSVNTPFNSITAFDASAMISQRILLGRMNNLGCNLNTLCKEFNFACKDFQTFKKFNPKNYPCTSIIPDGGIYTMLYADNWFGNFMKEFSKEVIPKYRMSRAYDMFFSWQNEIEVDSFEKKKRKKRN